MALPPSASDFYRDRQAVTVAVVSATRRVWGRMGADFDQSWRRLGPRIISLLAAGQLATVRLVEPFVADVLEETGQPDRAVGRVVNGAFVGTAADGRTLAGLLYGAVVAAKRQMANEATPREAVAAGGRWLDMATQTALADTARTATQTAIVARPTVQGYIRMVNPPACSRCLLLAGRWYRWDAGFDRHPRCDCTGIPASENVAGDMTTDPNTYFRSIDAAEQDRIFGKAGAQAIRDGADMNQVVNARRGMYTTVEGHRVTRSGTTRRGRSPGGRLAPEAIYNIARTREEAIGLLARFGYIA